MDHPDQCPYGVEHDVVHGCEIMEERHAGEQADGTQGDEDRGDRHHHYLYRAGQLLVDAAEEPRAREQLVDIGVPVIDDDNEPLDDRTRRCLRTLGLNRIRVDETRLAVPEIVTAIDRLEGPRVRPNHVLVSAFHFHVGPATPPRAASPKEFDTVSTLQGGAVGLRRPTRVLVLDTGLVQDNTVRTTVLKDRCSGDDETVPTGPLPRNVGHGTFIAGLICKHTDRTEVVVRDVVDECGYVDDLALAGWLEDIPEDVDILNLSFGGYGFDGEMAATVAQLKALAFRNPELVVIAAAGNDGNDLPFLPAALPNVIGVAAVERNGEGPPWRRACFSNFGPWVDACAEGVDRVSAFLNYDGELAPYEPPHPCRGGQEPGATAAVAPALRGKFERRAKWSGTSFAAPLVTAAIAQRMTTQGQTAREAARDLIFDRNLPRLPGLGVLVEPPIL